MIRCFITLETCFPWFFELFSQKALVEILFISTLTHYNFRGYYLVLIYYFTNMFDDSIKVIDNHYSRYCMYVYMVSRKRGMEVGSLFSWKLKLFVTPFSFDNFVLVDEIGTTSYRIEQTSIDFWQLVLSHRLPRSFSSVLRNDRNSSYARLTRKITFCGANVKNATKLRPHVLTSSLFPCAWVLLTHLGSIRGINHIVQIGLTE